METTYTIKVNVPDSLNESELHALLECTMAIFEETVNADNDIDLVSIENDHIG